MKIKFKIKRTVLTPDDMVKRLKDVPHVTGFRKHSGIKIRTIVIRTKVGLSEHEREFIRNDLYHAFKDVLMDIEPWIRGHHDRWICTMILIEPFRVGFDEEYKDTYSTYEDKV